MKLLIASLMLAAIGVAQMPPPCPPVCPKGGDRRQTKKKVVKEQKPQATASTKEIK